MNNKRRKKQKSHNSMQNEHDSQATNYYTLLIKPVMDSIEKEEKNSLGVGGRHKMLSLGEQAKLLMDFMRLRANPEKNRAFQHIKALIEENKKKQLLAK